MSKLSQAAKAVAKTLETLESQTEVFLREAEAVRRASQRWDGANLLGGEDPNAARAWSLIHQAATAALAAGHARALGKDVTPARRLDDVFKGS